MPIQIILAAVAVSVSLPVLYWSVASTRVSAASAASRERILGKPETTDARSLVLQQGIGKRVGVPMLRAMGVRLRSLTPAGWTDSLRKNLVLAGNADTTSVERMLVTKFGLGAAGLALGLLGPFGSVPRLQPLIVLGVTALGFFLPDLLIAQKGKARQHSIQLELPDTLDQIRMSVDAGLGFEAALARVARSGEGPFADELQRTLREIQLGIPRPQALRNLSSRTAVSDLDSFILAVVQSEQYGIPVAGVLRVQSDELRDKRFQRAEEQAMKLPVKLIFPLAMCIFPAMFIILLGPAVIRIFRDLGGALVP